MGPEGTPSHSHEGAVPEGISLQMGWTGNTTGSDMWNSHAGNRTAEDSSHLEMIYYTSMLDSSSIV